MELAVEHIDVSLGKPAKRVLDDVSFRAEDGSFVSLLGASGAGKSTLLKVVSGVLVQEGGAVLFDGEPVDALPPHRRGLGFVFQDMRLFPHMTVRENVAFPCKMLGMGTRARARRADELLERVQLEGFGERAVRELSGGQAQRVALARALAARPRALLLDEPFSGLDEALRDDMRSLLLHLHREEGVTTVMVTHDAVEAAMMSDRVVYVSAGRVLQEGEPAALYEHPAAEEIAACFGECSRLQGEASGGVFAAGDLRLPAPPTLEGAAQAVVRFDGVFANGEREQGKAAGRLPVRCSVYRGGGNLVRLDAGGQTLSVPSATAFEAGQFVDVCVDPVGCFVFGVSS